MRGRKDICLLCRHTSRITNTQRFTKGYASIRKKEPYILPRLVIDLDANDSKYVRRAEDLEPNVPSEENHTDRFRRSSHQKGKGDEREKRSFRRVQLMGRDNNGPFRTRITTALDIFGYALQGDPLSTRSSGSPTLREIFEERRIHTFDNSETKIQQLLHDFAADEPSNLRVAGFGALDVESIRLQIQRYTSFRSLSRAISMLSSTADGCRFLAANGDSVVEGVRSCRKAQEYTERLEVPEPSATVQAVIQLLNNLFLSMKSKGIQIGPDLCNAGLYYSAKGFQLQSTKMYLEAMVDNGYPTNLHAKRALSYLSLNMGRPLSFHTTRNKLAFGIDRRQAVLNLLTGWESNGTPLPGEQRKASFASLLSQDRNGDFSINLYPAYVVGFGQMGESKVLLRECTSLDDTLLPQILRGEQNSTSRACLLAMGLILANDPEKAGEILRTGFAQTSHGGEMNVMWPVLLNFYNSRHLLVDPSLEHEIKGFAGHDWQSALDLIKRLVLYNPPAGELLGRP
jgi:hypothetical protein